VAAKISRPKNSWNNQYNTISMTMLANTQTKLMKFWIFKDRRWTWFCSRSILGSFILTWRKEKSSIMISILNSSLEKSTASNVRSLLIRYSKSSIFSSLIEIRKQ